MRHLACTREIEARPVFLGFGYRRVDDAETLHQLYRITEDKFQKRTSILVGRNFQIQRLVHIE